MSVAFGAPIGGVLFSLEQVSYYFPDKVMWHSFVCAMIAAVSLQAMNPFRTGKLVLWQVSYDRNWHDFEVWSFIVIGLMGVCSLLLPKLMKGIVWCIIFENEYEGSVLEKTFLDTTLSYFRSSRSILVHCAHLISDNIHSVYLS